MVNAINQRQNYLFVNDYEYYINHLDEYKKDIIN